MTKEQPFRERDPQEIERAIGACVEQISPGGIYFETYNQLIPELRKEYLDLFAEAMSGRRREEVLDLLTHFIEILNEVAHEVTKEGQVDIYTAEMKRRLKLYPDRFERYD